MYYIYQGVPYFPNSKSLTCSTRFQFWVTEKQVSNSFQLNMSKTHVPHDTSFFPCYLIWILISLLSMGKICITHEQYNTKSEKKIYKKYFFNTCVKKAFFLHRKVNGKSSISSIQRGLLLRREEENIVFGYDQSIYPSTFYG